ncbi:MAG: MFS transporter [Thermoplasmata archaeon]|jgi:MFS family permease
MNINLVRIIGSRGLLSFSYGYLNIILSLYLYHIGYGFITIGAIIGTAIIINALLALFLSMLADHYGRRNVLFILFILFSVSSGLFLYTRDPILISLLSGLGGFTGSGGGPIGSGGPFGAIQTALVTEFTDRKNFSRVLGIASAIGMILNVLGSLTLTLIENLHMNVYMLFYLASLLGLAGAIISFGIEDRRIRSRNILPKVSWKNIIKLSLPTIPSGIGAGMIMPIFSLWFNLKFHISAGEIGIIFASANAFTTLMMLVMPLIISHRNELKAIVWSRIGASLSLIALAISPTLILSWVFYVLRAGLQMGTVPIRQSFSMGIVDETERATSSGITSFTRTGFSSASPPVSGALMSYSIDLPPLLGGIFLFFDPLLYYLLFRKHWA